MEGKKAHQEMYDAGMRTGVISILGFVFVFLLIMTGRSEHPLGDNLFDQRGPLVRSGIPLVSGGAAPHTGGGSPAVVGQDEERYQDYLVRITNYENEGSFEILKNGRQVYSLHKASNFGFAKVREGKNYLLLMGTDVTGNGQPELVISEWSLGAHCCYTFHLFEIGDRFRHIQSIDAGSSESARFLNLDGLPGLEFITDDWTFAYEPGGFADPPVPRVILKFDGTSYVFARELMKQDPPDEGLVHAIAKNIQTMDGWPMGSPPAEIMQEMVDLIYSGNMAHALSLLDQAWPADVSGKDDFLLDLTTTLKKSPFYREILSLNQ
ncbi:conserved hypothetical protein [anaerobic digester metagenome]|jgi:hypothetical protein|uniref:Uncharacterized protein n=1 Tax=anaerobic digester metagenome TaxID=1263854 RepID=A0A485M3C0_9ZZZZ|nr:hypothetical protein [Deltaproteobacteria bacterium]HPX17496.1 hypothetical protein [Deltaproteobacteria bacterium]